MTRLGLAVALVLAAAAIRGAAADERPDAIVDLRTSEGAALVAARWRYADARIVEADHRSPGPDLKPTGPPNRTHDVVPSPGRPEFESAPWEAIDATSLEARRS